MKRCFFIFLATVLALTFLPLSQLLARSPQSNKTEAPPENARLVTVYNHKTDTITEENLEEYLVGVVAAEMPALYEVETLKAQAVAARSYILSKLGKGNPDHNGADICTNSAHCKAYISPADAEKNWGDRHAEYLEKITSAVNSTAGEYISYEGTAAVACFYAVSGGKTESAKDVWGGDTPYLRSVESPYDLTYEGLTAVSSFSTAEACSRLGVSSLETGSITRTEGGSVKTIIIGGKEFSGTEIRSLLELNSANFEITAEENGIKLTTTGKGHGVGMSQYGANKMAQNGKTYKEILLHYYQGVTIDKI